LGKFLIKDLFFNFTWRGLVFCYSVSRFSEVQKEVIYHREKSVACFPQGAPVSAVGAARRSRSVPQERHMNFGVNTDKHR
jgi:hypothetical protein